MEGMTEIRCGKCKKICGYLKTGSRIANGTTFMCVHCSKPEPMPDFMSELMRGKWKDWK